MLTFRNFAYGQVNAQVLVVTVLVGRVHPEFIQLVDVDLVHNERARLAITSVLLVHAVVGFTQQIAVNVGIALYLEKKWFLIKETNSSSNRLDSRISKAP
jgi:hypothetical protein